MARTRRLLGEEVQRRPGVIPSNDQVSGIVTSRSSGETVVAGDDPGTSDLFLSRAFGDSWEGRVDWGPELRSSIKVASGFLVSSSPAAHRGLWCRTQHCLGVTAPLCATASRLDGLGSVAERADESGVDWCNSTLANWWIGNNRGRKRQDPGSGCTVLSWLDALTRRYTIGHMDALAALEKGFREQLEELWGRHPEIQTTGVAEAEEAGRGAARHAVAPIVWRSAVGDVWDTSKVTELLGVSRQALAQRIQSRTLLGLRGRGTTLYPTWQFDAERRAVRPIVAALLAEFRNAQGVEPWTVASWATTPQTELRGNTPAELLMKGAPEYEYDVLAAANHSAARLAQ